MLVCCPSCQTKYRVSEEILRGAPAVFRCSRCKHTFEREAVDGAQDTTAQELTFGFARNDGHETAIRSAAAAQAAGKFSDLGESAMDTDSGERWTLSVADVEPEKPFTLSAAEAAPNDDILLQAGQTSPQETIPPLGSAEKILPFDPHRDQSASTKPFLTLFGLLIIFFFSVSALHQAHPKTTESVVQRIPVVGPAVLRNDYLKHRIVLQSLSGRYQSVQGNREVFIVTGSAYNTNSVVVREVQIAGRVYDQEGKNVDQQTVWVGNAISSKIIRGMTVQDIVDLQRLPPLKTFSIPPGESVPFAVVFMKTIKGLKDFTCEVVSARGEL